MKHVAFPFLTLGEPEVNASPWRLIDQNGGTSELGDHVPGWDYARNLELNREIGLAKGTVGKALNLPEEDLDLELVVRLGTGPGSIPRRRRLIIRALIRPGEPFPLGYTAVGHELSQRLWLETSILLARPTRLTARFAPTRPGSILWRDEHDVRLEGSSPRFPMEIVSFRERFSGKAESGALWYLHWQPGHLHRDFGGSVRLFLNDDRKDFIERFVGSDPQTLQCVLGDVVSQILGHALRAEDLEEILADCEPTSVAGHVATWLELAFAGPDLASVRKLLTNAPGSFNAAIQAMANLQVMGGAE